MLEETRTTREADDRMIRKALLQGRDDGSRRFDDPASERRFRQDARPSVEKLHNFGARLDLRCEKVDVAIVMSGGTEGGLSPHFLVFGVREYRHSRGQRKSLAIGTASTPVLLPEQIGRMPQVELTAAAVRAAIESAAIADDADVHWVQIKCPLLTSERIADAAASRGAATATGNTYASMALSRGASALGVALALGEVDREALDDREIGRELGLWSPRASASAGVELLHSEIIVLGQ